MFANLNNIRWAGDAVVFPFTAGGGRGRGGARGAPAVEGRESAPADTQTPADDWDRYYSISVTTPNAKPILLTTTDGLIEDQTSVTYSADGKTFFYCTNAKDIERRHIWSVPTSGGTPQQVTVGDGIETYPAPPFSGWRRSLTPMPR